MGEDNDLLPNKYDLPVQADNAEAALDSVEAKLALIHLDTAREFGDDPPRKMTAEFSTDGANRVVYYPRTANY